MRALIIALAGLIWLTGCVSEKERSRRQIESEMRARYARDFASLSSEEVAICEAVFRYQFSHNASAAQRSAAAYFITVCANDPSPEFVARFHDILPVVKPGSKFRAGHGLAFGVSTIRVIEDRAAEVSGGYYEGNLSSSGNTYRLERTGGVWSVVGDDMKWISAMPNQSLEPTRMLGTSAAEQPRVPSTRVAHL